jgi:hypothetical protein
MTSKEVRRSVLTSADVAVNLAVMTAKIGGDGWESNPLRTPQQRPADGFEDRGANVHDCPPTSAEVRFLTSAVRNRPPSSVVVHRLGCQRTRLHHR